MNLLDLPDIDHIRMMNAIAEAQKAAEEDEVPVGAVIYHGNELIAKARNQREKLQDPTAHAEILAITQAALALGSWRLTGCTLYVTLEPCPMCAGAIIQARIPRVVWGADDPKAGAGGSVIDIFRCEKLNHHPEIRTNVLAETASEILKSFFKNKR